MRRCIACVAVASALIAAAPAHAQDSDAPPGAKRTWLPKEAWVLDHWLPYDEGLLFKYLGMSRQDIRVYFQGPKLQRVPPLAIVAKRRGYTVSGLARRLVNAWHPKVSAKKRALLLDRARRSLTQGHLTQHMFFHPMHSRGLFHDSIDIFGVSYTELKTGLQAGQSRRQIGHANGRTDAQLVDSTKMVLRRIQATGVRLHLTPASEARKELADQFDAIQPWLDLAGPGAADPQHMEHRAVARESMLCMLGDR